MSYESKENVHLLGASFIRLNELGRMSNYPDWSQFSLPKRIIRGVIPPCLMPMIVFKTFVVFSDNLKSEFWNWDLPQILYGQKFLQRPLCYARKGPYVDTLAGI